MGLNRNHKLGLGAVIVVAIVGLTVGLVLGLDDSSAKNEVWYDHNCM